MGEVRDVSRYAWVGVLVCGGEGGDGGVEGAEKGNVCCCGGGSVREVGARLELRVEGL